MSDKLETKAQDSPVEQKDGLSTLKAFLDYPIVKFFNFLFGNIFGLFILASSRAEWVKYFSFGVIFVCSIGMVYQFVIFLLNHREGNLTLTSIISLDEIKALEAGNTAPQIRDAEALKPKDETSIAAIKADPKAAERVKQEKRKVFPSQVPRPEPNIVAKDRDPRKDVKEDESGVFKDGFETDCWTLIATFCNEPEVQGKGAEIENIKAQILCYDSSGGQLLKTLQGRWLKTDGLSVDFGYWSFQHVVIGKVNGRHIEVFENKQDTTGIYQSHPFDFIDELDIYVRLYNNSGFLKIFKYELRYQSEDDIYFTFDSLGESNLPDQKLLELAKEDDNTEIDKALLIEIEDVVLVFESGMENASTLFVTVDLIVRNTKEQDNTIFKTELFVQKAHGSVQGIAMETPFVKKAGTRSTEIVPGSNETVVFSQGIPAKYAKTFKFENEFLSKQASPDSIKGKQFVLKITDSYNGTYQIRGIVPVKANVRHR